MPPLDKRIKKFLKNSIRVAPKISNKGELAELRAGLVSQYPQTRKDAIKKTIQQMTLGKDVSSLFPDVLKNIATNDVEQKKLVYLYVMNYAETHPELCILAVNTFVTDAQDPNPLIRCMSIRTMSMIRVDKILEYVEIPLRRTLQDDNPYVRKTAVICVAKLFQLNKELCQELGVLEDLVSALDDSNPMVVANATASLTEINSMDPTVISLLDLIQSHVSQFLLALNECTEWARITILGALAEYTAKDCVEAQEIIDRVSAHLQHVNPAVVLATIKVIIKNMVQIEPESKKIVMSKLSSALVSIMSTPPEMQYVALRNIRIILEKYPDLLTKELRIFYVKFNDPLYVKLEKIDILVRLVDRTNLKQCQVLMRELKEYAMEFEPEFVTRAIQGLTQLAVKCADTKFVSKTFEILLELLETQEALKDDCCIALCNLLRHATGNEKLATDACNLLDTWPATETLLMSDSAKCNYVWLMGQYPTKFNELEEKLSCFLENFAQEEPLTQTSLLVTVVRLHSILPGSVLQTILELATHEIHELDVRDMAIIYWRCLSMPNSDTLIEELCSSVAPQIENLLDTFSPQVLEKLLAEISSVSSIYFKPQFEGPRGSIQHHNIVRGRHIDELKDLAKNELARKANDDVLLDFDEEDEDFSSPRSSVGGGRPTSNFDDFDTLFDFSSSQKNGGSNINKGMADLNLEQQQHQISNNGNDNKTKISSNTQDLLDLF
ncbi:APL2 (YKL135C) [Zygosaccharomyces parabailii]|nr:APL2 (YKL135C) [Zygosaccharomyces parabailii]